MKAKYLLYAFVATGAVAAYAAQTDLGPVGTYVQSLHKAQSLVASFKALKSGIQPTNYKVSFGKTGKYRIETGTTLWVCDGKKLWTLTKAANTYTEEDASLTPLKTDALAEFYGFFDGGQFGDSQSIEDSGSRQIEGSTAEIYTIQEKSGKTIKLFLDSEGNAKGEQVVNGHKMLLTIVKSVKVSDQPLADDTFTFVPPAGAKKVVAVSGADYAAVDKIFQANCMPCHSSSRQAGGLDLSSYAALMKGGGGGPEVVPGNPKGSALYQYISGSQPSMPRGRAPLTAEEQKTIHDWIKNGAKGP